MSANIEIAAETLAWLRPSYKASALRPYDFELRPPALGRFWKWQFKDDTGNIVLAPDRSADIARSEVVQAKFQLIGQELGFKSKLNANTKAGEIVNDALVNGRVATQDLCWVVGPRALRSPVFVLPIFHTTVRLLEYVLAINILDKLKIGPFVSNAMVGASLTRWRCFALSLRICDRSR
jgi:hypothetical protein